MQIRLQTLCVLAALACEAGPDELDLPPCVELADCTPLYLPTWEQVYSHTLSTGCGSGQCHDDPEHESGILFETPQQTYDLMLDRYVVPGDSSCSPLVVILERGDMPPGPGHLDDGVRCSIQAWIADGALP